jgi:hypothetical protein
MLQATATDDASAQRHDSVRADRKGENVRTRSIAALILGLGLLAGPAMWAVAAPITLNFGYSQGAATATGSITFESTLLNNPGTNNFTLPNAAVLALQVTVSGATSGNGTFGIGSFTGVSFSTGGGTLNLGTELVGQPTPGGPWGPLGGGDFNLFSAIAPAPTGVDPFILGANQGTADAMTLRTVAPAAPAPAAAAPIPALSLGDLLFLALVLGGAGIVLIRHRQFARLPG